MKITHNSLAVEAKNIIKEYKIGNTTTRVLKEVSLQVIKGEFVSIMG